jgi:hypothetical protein
VVECDLAKVEVAGSNPVSRSIRLGFGALLARAFCLQAVRDRTPVDFLGVWRYLRFQGAVPKW